MQNPQDFQRIVVKVGTNVLTDENGLLDMAVINSLIDQIANLKEKGIEIILVSSGAVGAGKSVLQLSPSTNKIAQRQVYSAIGQIRLMNMYAQILQNHHLHCAQVLATKEDFRDRLHYLNMKQCFHALLRDNIIPIVNENDVVAVSELMFTDNDELAGLIAAMVNADALVLLTNVNGIYDGNPNDPKSKLIEEIDASDKKIVELIAPVRSSFGRGGMHTKLRIAQKAARVGIRTFIANGKHADILLDIYNNNFTGTRFTVKAPVSNVKKWIAYNHTEKKGTVYINEGAAVALCAEDKISSLLPVGIINIEGDFKKGDIIQIVDEQKKNIGWGIAQYGATKAQGFIGQKGKKPLVHYDYLFVR